MGVLDGVGPVVGGLSTVLGRGDGAWGGRSAVGDLISGGEGNLAVSSGSSLLERCLLQTNNIHYSDESQQM